MSFPTVTREQWRARVEKELGGASFEKALIAHTLEGLAIEPLYTEAPSVSTQRSAAPPFAICMRHVGVDTQALADDLAGGADALWLDESSRQAVLSMDRGALGKTVLLLDIGSDPEAIVAALPPAQPFVLAHDPVARRAAGLAAWDTLDADLQALGRSARAIDEQHAAGAAAVVSSIAYHEAGAGVIDELASALSTGALYLDTLLETGLPIERASRQIVLQTTVSRDTFLELCKVRALRACWQKLLAASGAPNAERTRIHAVCSTRTLGCRDPWVNMLRVTTQAFSAILGGADLFTPATFDQALGTPSELGRRVARNTGLVLREESYLGRVTDPAAGSYYLDTLTDALARQAWTRFQALEKDGGILHALRSGSLQTTIEGTWHARLEAVAKRRLPILGVSEFANLDEKLPESARDAEIVRRADALPSRRDAEIFEALRTQAEQKATPPEAVLVTLGTLAETRPRAGFAAAFFSAGGFRTRESEAAVTAPVVCLCGPDERYQLEAADRARALKAAGCKRVLLAGRPGALEATLREAGVDGFVYVGCDLVATLSELLEELP